METIKNRPHNPEQFEMRVKKKIQRYEIYSRKLSMGKPRAESLKRPKKFAEKFSERDDYWPSTVARLTELGHKFM